MFQRSGSILVLSILAGTLEVAAAESPELSRELDIRDDRVLVKLTPEAAELAVSLPADWLPTGVEGLDAFVARQGLALTGYRAARHHGMPVRDVALFRKVGLDRWYVLRLPHSDRKLVRQLVVELGREPWVEHVELVGAVSKLATPNDALFPNQWAHQNMRSTQAWDFETGDPGALCAVLDIAFDLDHVDVAPNFVAGYDFLDDDTDPGDAAGGHGTEVSGMAAARGNNSIGVAGICWDCSLMPLRIYYQDNVVDALRYAADAGADAINMSFMETASWARSTFDAVEYAFGSGALPVAAVGNDGLRFPGVPAAFPNVVAVGATQSNDHRAFFSNRGDHLDVVAPGDGVYTTSTNPVTFQPTYAQLSGTSYSTPLVSGLATLLRSYRPGLHVNELRHLILLGADDLVGNPLDAPGWDVWMGYGRINARRSLQLADGPWLALDQSTYVCGGQLRVRLKDQAATSPVTVTLQGLSGSDAETVTLTPVTASGYYEGTLDISWAGQDGPVVTQDGKLDVINGETIRATRGGLTANAKADCVRMVCVSTFRPIISGDCDRDGALDPAEEWLLAIPPSVREELPLYGATTAVLTTTHPAVQIVENLSTFEELHPYVAGGNLPDEDRSDDPFRIRLAAGVPANDVASFHVSIGGEGWQPDESECTGTGFPATFSLRLNRDLGPQINRWDFDDGTAQGFTHALSHNTGALSQCGGVVWADGWQTAPVTDRAHSGTHALRYGTGSTYGTNQDGAMATPSISVPAGGGALSFYLWMDTDLESGRLSYDGLALETNRPGDPTWSFLKPVTYNTDLRSPICGGGVRFPFGSAEAVDLFAGDGTPQDGSEDLTDGDTFDIQHQADLSLFAGATFQVRFRFGGDNEDYPGDGVWLDTVTLHGPYVAESWTGPAPANLSGSDDECPTSFDLSWNAVAGAGGYAVYRSEISCADAVAQPIPYGSTPQPTFSDSAAVAGIDYYYAVAALEAGSGCSSARSCVPGSCLCEGPPADPTGLRVSKAAPDVVLSWNDPASAGLQWNVYRGMVADPSAWGPPHAAGVEDEDGGTAGIQHSDTGALSASESFFYLIRAEGPCGESLP